MTKHENSKPGRHSKPIGAIYKSEICEMYGFGSKTLQKLLNVKYFDKLKALDYEKRDHYLSPKQFQFFQSKYGAPKYQEDAPKDSGDHSKPHSGPK